MCRVSDLLLVSWEERDQAMMVNTMMRSTATTLHVIAATVEEDSEELSGTPGKIESWGAMRLWTDGRYLGSGSQLWADKEDWSLSGSRRRRKMSQIDHFLTPTQLKRLSNMYDWFQDIRH